MAFGGEGLGESERNLISGILGDGRDREEREREERKKGEREREREGEKRESTEV